MQALRGILFDFFSFFLVGVLKLLVGYLKTNIIVQYCTILTLFLRFLGEKRKYLERVSMLLEYILNIFIQYPIFIFDSTGDIIDNNYF